MIEDMIVGIAEVVMNPEVVDIEVEGDMMEVLESIHLAEAAVNIDLGSIRVPGVIQVTDLGMMIEDPLQAAILPEAILEEVRIDLEMTIEEDMHRDESILLRIVMKVEAHRQVHLHIVHPADIAAAHPLKDLTDIARVVNTEVNTGAVVEAEITALLTHQVIEKKVVAMSQEGMTLVLEGILHQEMIIMLLVAELQEAVLHLHLLPTLDTQAKNVKRFENIKIKRQVREFNK